MDYTVTVDDYRDFLCNLFDVWYKDQDMLKKRKRGMFN
jgi:hypothetical protein